MLKVFSPMSLATSGSRRACVKQAHVPVCFATAADDDYDSCDEEDYIRATELLNGKVTSSTDSFDTEVPSESPIVPSTRSSVAQEELLVSDNDLSPSLRVRSTEPAEEVSTSETSGWLSGFFAKLHAAWLVFFPGSSGARGTPRDQSFNRLKVVLVADRIGLNPAAIEDMTQTIVEALSQYVEVADTQDVQVDLSEGTDLGALYSISVPVKRVKYESALRPMQHQASILDADGVSVVWDEQNWDADPSGRFPYGT